MNEQHNKFSPKERAILQSLDDTLKSESVRGKIEAIAGRVEQKLIKTRGALMTWEPVPLGVYGKSLPEKIRSSWVFVLRAHSDTGAESHPNSHQRMMSFRNSGDFQIWDGTKWISNNLVSDPSAPLEKRWVSIPPGVPHRSAFPLNNWIVVSFHTVGEDQLIEERQDPGYPKLKRRKYINKI
jgi:hypothetical protein